MEGLPAPAETRGAASTASDWRQWYEAVRRRIDAAISAHVKTLETSLAPHGRLSEAVEYSIALRGKRLRPVLVLETCRICGGREETALAAAIAVECVHTFSLIHDDLPAMDDDELRRGQPCSHKVFGEAQAILAGDWLAVHPFAWLASEYPAELAAALVQTLARSTLGMIEGQSADEEGAQQAADPNLVEFIHRQKTGRLIECSCRMGALCAEASEESLAALGRFGHHLGLAFQIADDLLDVTGSPRTVGKRVRKDAAAAKQTYPAAFGIEASRARARQETETALAALAPFGAQADRLRGLARYAIARDR